MHTKNILEKCQQKEKILKFSLVYNALKQQLILQPKYNFVGSHAAILLYFELVRVVLLVVKM